MKNHYKILEIDDFSDTGAIRRAYRKLSKLYHPDVNPHYPPAAEMFKRINDAHAVLSDPVRKAAFDQQLRTEQYGDASHEPEANDVYGTSEYAGMDLHADSTIYPGGVSYATYTFGNSENMGSPQDQLWWQIPVFEKILYVVDALFGVYIVFYFFNLDISMVPKESLILGGYNGWPVHLDLAIICQCATSLYSLLQAVGIRSILSRFPLFTDSVFEKMRFIHLIGKLFTAFWYIAPMFGVTLFGISGKTLFAACVLNGILGLLLILPDLD